MKLAIVVAAVAIAGILPTVAGAQSNNVRTKVKNGGNAAVVVQSGDPASAQVQIEQRPGYTRIEQHSANNNATIIQSDPAPDSH
jgi:hypothetical protein